MINVLIIDNYDSFVYNLAQYLGELGAKCTVVRNDEITLQEIVDAAYDAIVISPGPGTPEDKRYFGVCSDVILQLGTFTPILGVCLGHQGIIHAFGGKVVNASCVRHGKTSMIRYAAENGTRDDDDDVLINANSELFTNVSNPFSATRYHSLVGDKTVIPDVLSITARAEDDGEIMGVQHKMYPIHGVQFHPESIMTTHGKTILSNFLKLASNVSTIVSDNLVASDNVDASFATHDATRNVNQSNNNNPKDTQQNDS